MEQLIASKKYKEAFDVVISELENDPESKEKLKELFIFFKFMLLLSADLQSQNKDLEVLTCFEIALKYYVKDSDLLTELGSFFAK
ncbi:CLUMA_CG014099, isoform A [Clunio marinus]|uniref:CLUMA_CG014099, isoform A n=1 Tax=Clunio marinus TaxID=568069 RepID=A0A1J1IL09_9DIPT|nr:CLUMA_CG014099, isoform A [Clunio marinus]